ncbi:MAG: hypothetical protein COA79_04315 [Planctomycetota bacterium]|nr:MAG: hypothetical protein COA79_04315 [Planctomycetota bacterium]
MKILVLLISFLFHFILVSAGNLCYLKGDPGFRVTFRDGGLDEFKPGKKIRISYSTRTMMLCGYYGVSYAEISTFKKTHVTAIKQFIKKYQTGENEFDLCFYLVSKDFKSPVGKLEEREKVVDKRILKSHLAVISEFNLIAGCEPRKDNDDRKKDWYKILKDGKWEALKKLPEIRSKQNKLVAEYHHSGRKKNKKVKPELSGLDAYRIMVNSDGGHNWRTREQLIRYLEIELKKNPSDTLRKELAELKKFKPRGKR